MDWITDEMLIKQLNRVVKSARIRSVIAITTTVIASVMVGMFSYLAWLKQDSNLSLAISGVLGCVWGFNLFIYANTWEDNVQDLHRAKVYRDMFTNAGPYERDKYRAVAYNEFLDLIHKMVHKHAKITVVKAEEE